MNEKHKSRITAGFLAKVISSFFVIMLASMKFKLFGKTILGSFDDFTPMWYITVGYSIVTAFFFAPITDTVVSMLKILWTFVKKWIDRGYSCCKMVIHKDGTPTANTKKHHHKDYLSLYSNKEFTLNTSYTIITNVLFVVISLMPIMPTISFLGMFNLFIYYWKDKCTLLCLSKWPPQFDSSMSKQCRNILLGAVVFNLLLSIWNYGNINIFDSEAIHDDPGFSYVEPKTNFLSTKEFFRRFKSAQAIMYTVMLVILMIIGVVYAFIGNFMEIIHYVFCGCFRLDKTFQANSRKGAAARFTNCMWRYSPNHIDEELANLKSDYDEDKHCKTDKNIISMTLSLNRIAEQRKYNLNGYERIDNSLRPKEFNSRIVTYDPRAHPELKYIFKNN